MFSCDISLNKSEIVISVSDLYTNLRYKCGWTVDNIVLVYEKNTKLSFVKNISYFDFVLYIIIDVMLDKLRFLTAELASRCLQSHLQISPSNPQKTYAKFWKLRTNEPKPLCPNIA